MSNTSRNSKKLILMATILSALLSYPADKASCSDEQPAEEGTCSFATTLQNEYERNAYLEEVRAAKYASESKYGEVFSNTVQAKLSNGETMEVDRFSVDCMSCHDGNTAKGRDIRYKNDSQNRTSDILSVRGSHPIGMHYGSYAYGSREFKPLGTLKPEMLLIDGKVGCLTCHNMLNNKKHHLATSNERSKLCYSCHNI